MAAQIDTVTEACRHVSRQVKDVFRNLTIHYIVHHSGQRKEALAVAAQEILTHPAAETALHVLQKVRRSEDSAVLGTSVARKSLFFGMAGQDTMLSLCTLNLEQFDNAKDAKRHAWHLAWHAIDALEYHAQPENRDGRSDIILRRRNAIEMAGANMRADTFSAAISALQGDLAAVKGIAMTRGINSLSTRSLHNPEFYPFVLARDATEFAIGQMLKKAPSKKRQIPAALKTASDIGKTVDDESLRHWLGFSEPAQDMAWRGFTPQEILAAAINTSEDTSVRATGYLVSEITGIEAESVSVAKNTYSPFADDAFNQQLHEKAVQAVFEDVIAQGMRQQSADPFIRLANSQNESLTEGHILGWCASALQAAGKAYQRVLDGSQDNDHVMREFEGERKSTSWEDLRALGKEIVYQYRQGHVVTLSRLEQLCADEKALASIRKAVTTTMRDPQHQRRLSAARELETMPRAAMEKARRPKSPASAPSMVAAPGNNFPGSGSRMSSARVASAQTSTGQDSGKDGDSQQGTVH